MQYTTVTPPSLDHVLTVIGKDRFIAQFDTPMHEWDLTPNEIARIKAGPHGQLAVYFLDTEYMGFPFTEVVIECECGQKFAERLLSEAQRQHDAHTGYIPESHIHTAQLLEG